jgi:hypothetical protein
VKRTRRKRRFREEFVAARSERAHTVEVDGEAVVLDEATGRLHLLNTTGALVWRCFDGESSIGEIVSDISDAINLPRDAVLADVLAITRQLGEEGLLAGVTPTWSGGVIAETLEAEEKEPDGRFVPEPPNP